MDRESVNSILPGSAQDGIPGVFFNVEIMNALLWIPGAAMARCFLIFAIRIHAAICSIKEQRQRRASQWRPMNSGGADFYEICEKPLTNLSLIGY